MAEEKVSIAEFGKGYAKPSSWWKAFGICSKFLIIIAVGWAVYVAFVKPWINPLKTQTQTIKVEKGATAIIQQKQAASKRFFIPFIEAGVEQRNDKNMGTYIRAGARIEW